jgi:hypothetical protein
MTEAGKDSLKSVLDWVLATGAIGLTSIGYFAAKKSIEREKQRKELEQEIINEIQPICFDANEHTRKTIYSAIVSVIADADNAAGSVVTRNMEDKEQIIDAAKLVISSAWQLMFDYKHLEKLHKAFIEKAQSKAKQEQQPEPPADPVSNPEPTEATQPETPTELP